MNVHPAVADALAAIKPRGEGRDNSLMRPARLIARYMPHVSLEDGIKLIEGAMPDGNFRRTEARRALRRALEGKDSGTGSRTRLSPALRPPLPPPKPKLPDCNEEQRAALIAAYPDELDRLLEESPVKFDDDTRHTETVLDILFQRHSDPWLCIGDSYAIWNRDHNGDWQKETSFRFITRRREWMRGRRCVFGPWLPSWEFIVPSARAKQFALTDERKPSQHAQAACGPRDYIIIEQDRGDHREQAALLVEMRKYLPLVMVVDSGGKSAHGWYCCAGVPESDLFRFMSHACVLGADKPLFNPNQFTRLPDGTRHQNGARQRILYFNPEAIQ